MSFRSIRNDVALLAAAACGCIGLQTPANYQTVFPSPVHSREAAEEANERGLIFTKSGDYERAEKAFRQALRADVTYPAAHNNLGLVLLSKARWHESALEFSFAGKLDPLAPEPLINMGRLYEMVGSYAAAVTEYEEAFALDNRNLEAMGRLAYAYIRAGKPQDRIENLLRRLVGSEDSTQWRSWALAQLEVQGSAQE